MKKIFLGLMAILTMLAFTACGAKKEAADLKVVRYGLEQNPPQMDPQLTTDAISGQVLGHIFEGLTTIGENAKVLPGVAESWTADGNTWTFKLRKDAKWHNGDSVVAGDFAAAWERSLNPASAAEYAFIMYSIVGAQEYNEGKITDFAQVGVKATDDYTLVVNLKEPVTYFDSLVAFFAFLPQNQKFYAEHKDNYASAAENVLGNGPFKMSTWDFENKIILDKADTYWDKDTIKMDRIEMPIIVDTTAALKAYQNDELDWTFLPAEEFNNYKTSPELVPVEEARVIYMLINNKNKIFSNLNVRKAFSMAIDRQALVDKIKNGAGAVAEGVVPGIIPGKSGMFRAEYSQEAYGIGYNPEKAKELFAKGLEELGMKATDVPELTMFMTSTDVQVKEAQFYQEQLKVNLGLNIKLEPVTFQIRLQKQTSKDYDIILAGWGADYNDPMTFLDMWLSNSGQNNSNWESKEYDALIASAKADADPARRMDTLAKAEKILMEEVAIVPTFYRKKLAILKPYVKNVFPNPFSPDVDLRHADIQK